MDMQGRSAIDFAHVLMGRRLRQVISAKPTERAYQAVAELTSWGSMMNSGST